MSQHVTAYMVGGPMDGDEQIMIVAPDAQPVLRVQSPINTRVTYIYKWRMTHRLKTGKIAMTMDFKDTEILR